jgi:hypothetical protein
MAQGGYLPAFDDLLMPDMRLEHIVFTGQALLETGTAVAIDA